MIEIRRGMPAIELDEYYEKTLLSAVVLKQSDIFRYTLPSKLFQIMGRGIAVLYIGPEGEAAELVCKYKAGITLCGDKEENIQTLRHFFQEENWNEKLIDMGRNGRNAVLQHFRRSELTLRYAFLLEEIVKTADNGGT